MKVNNKQHMLFWVLIIALSIHFKFYETINLPPQSTDLWRQADCYSIALNYYQNGFHFFKPQVHFLFSQNGYAAGEFPLIYFISAILFKLFGVHFFLFKGLNLLIFFAGINALFKLSCRITHDIIFSYLLCILYFCTPIIFFYANNFLSDVSALSFNIIGLYCFVKFLEDKNKKQLSLAAICFAIAGLLKASASIVLIALICAVFIELFFTKTKSKYLISLKSNRNALFLQFGISLLLIIMWYLYAIYFNKSNGTIFFGTKAMKGWPIWENNLDELKYALNYFRTIHIEIISFINLTLFLLSLCIVIVFTKKVDSFYVKILIFLILGLTMFISYFWRGFQDQQYYLVNLIILPLLSIIFAYKIYLSFNPSQHIKTLTYALTMLASLFVIYSGKNVYKCYYKGGWRHQKLKEVYFDSSLEKKLVSLGITRQERVISIEDGTPNGTLSILNRSGWSSYGFGNDKSYTKDAFEAKIEMGAKYLILNDTTLLQNKIIKLYCSAPLGNYKDLYFYKLQSK